MAKIIYSFSELSDIRAVSRLDRDAARALLGGKGAGLFEMSRIGLPVPPGFTVTTEACRAGASRGTCARTREFLAAVAKLERLTGRKLSAAGNPLLVSVRSGSKFSMPGMMDTILNLGLNDETVAGLEAQTGDARFAWDCYRRFVAMFGSVVRGIAKDDFEAALRRVKAATGAESDADLPTAALRELVGVYQAMYKERAGSPFPQDPAEQLRAAVAAVFDSWNNPRAIAYRRLNRISDDLGTACTVQAMVFGNMGPDSATGVGFTRDPGTGERAFYGEYLVNAQGEDVVAGVRTPRPLSELSIAMPETYARLLEISAKLEKHYGDVQDMEFTIEKGRLYMLQTRTGKRSAMAALRIAVDMVGEGLITAEQAVMRLSPEQLDELLRPVFDEAACARAKVLARGLPAGPGAATGRVCFSADRAVAAAKDGPVILVRPETNPDDIHGMAAAEGILTATGGMTSHAAVVGRGMGKVCVVGCAGLEMDEGAGRTVRFAGETLKEGDWLSLDGFTGKVLAGLVETRPSEILEALLGKRPEAKSELFRRYELFMSWADAARTLEVRANADTPEDARAAVALGAAGIGLCRTEHMFFGEDRIPKVLAMILAGSKAERAAAVQALYPLQKADFKEIFETMRGLPVTIRTIDPPLHEFLPRTPEEGRRAAALHGFDAGKLWAKTLELKESNPMLGHRGCRLGITYPEITDMQARAILSAACETVLDGVAALPEIMIPLVGHAAELRHQKRRITDVAERVFREYGVAVAYQVGTMIEVPRAALTAGEIAQEAEFFSFGTNDLTQMTLGYSRDDYGRYIEDYLDLKILAADPFRSIDVSGVGRLVRLAVEEGRGARPGLKIGICGEHGGDPASIRFFHDAGLGYVSCSPYRVPVARLAGAQAALASRKPARPVRGLAKAAAVALAVLALLPGRLLANPADGTVVAGSAGISADGGTLTIRQTSENAIINWGGFSIGAGELTQFVQPSAFSAVLNRVTGGDPSAIYGTLQANGKVFLINPNGVAVGASGVINTQSFVASTLDLDDAAFMAGGALRFSGTSAAGVTNAGRISALGGDVVLIARTVRNEGEISAPDGTAALAAGTEVLFQPDGDERVFVRAGSGEEGGVGVDQKGSVIAAAVELKAAGGNVYSLAINQAGLVKATGVRSCGGRVYLVAEKGSIALRSGSVIDASGDLGGGTALIGGDSRGSNPAVPNASAVLVEEGAAVKADALVNGDGGKVVIWGADAVSFRGSVAARGAGSGGGGDAEISGSRLDLRGYVDLSAPGGAMGTLLLDPYDVTISGDPTAGIELCGCDNDLIDLAVADGANILDDFLVSQLQTANVVVETGDNGSPEGGDITVKGDADLTWTNNGSPFGPSGTLTLLASRDIVVEEGAVINAAGQGGVELSANLGAGTITLNADVATDGGDQTYRGAVVLGRSAELASNGGAIAFLGSVDGSGAGGQGLTVDSGGGDVSFAGPVGANAPLGTMIVDGLGGDVVLNGPVTAGNLGLAGDAVAWNGALSGENVGIFGGDLVMGGDVSSYGAGGVLMVAASSFRNPASRTITTAGGGRFLVYSVDPSFNVLGGLTGATQFGTTFLAGPAPVFPGSGFLYSTGSPPATAVPAPDFSAFDRRLFNNDRFYGEGSYSFDGCRASKDEKTFECENEASAAGEGSASPGDLFSWSLGELRDAVAEPDPAAAPKLRRRAR